MIPHPGSALTMLSGRLMMQLLPDLKSAYNMSDGMLIGILLNALAEELESGVKTRLEDIGEMREVFRQALDSHGAAALPADLESLIDQQPVDMSMNSVNELHDRMTRVLIDLHEMSESEAWDALNGEIWAYLGRQVMRHHITAAG
ncbi:MAG: hypothetical protein HUJ31_16685 [Pseudomonadales bacterium]|nr:hypothetical protein [Pseudomonadales bacterium]